MLPVWATPPLARSNADLGLEACRYYIFRPEALRGIDVAGVRVDLPAQTARAFSHWYGRQHIGSRFSQPQALSLPMPGCRRRNSPRQRAPSHTTCTLSCSNLLEVRVSGLAVAGFSGEMMSGLAVTHLLQPARQMVNCRNSKI